MARHGNLRASDADRDDVVERLRTAAGEGRLTSEELDERVRRALTAVTYADLAGVHADLPAPRRSAPAPGRRRAVGGWALTAVRANPCLLVLMIPLVAVTGAVLLAVAITCVTLMAVLMLLGGGHHVRRTRGRRDTWATAWSAAELRRDWRSFQRPGGPLR